MSNGYVTFKHHKTTGNETVLRGIEATKRLSEASGAEYAWTVRFAQGSGAPPDPNSEVFFKVRSRYSGTNIIELDLISERDFDRSKASQKVARFTHRKIFSGPLRKRGGSLDC